MANQTIIQAAGQRYAPTKIDYSGYIQGLASVATALVQKTTTAQKNTSALAKLSESVKTKITPWGDSIKSYIDYHPHGIAQKQSNVEHLNKQSIKLEDLQTKLSTIVDPEKGPGLSKSIDPEIRYWINAYANGDFDQTFTVKEKRDVIVGSNEEGETVEEEFDIEKEFNMNFQIDENFNVKVIGPKGEYISLDEMENLLNVAQKSDGDELLNEITTFSNKVADPDIETPKFDTWRDNTLTKITTLINDGSDGISAKRIMESFMFDKTFIVKGEETGFLDWYLDNEALMPPEFKEEFLKYREEYQIGGEIEEEVVSLIAQDLIKNDPNIKEDFMNFIKTTLESYR
jgi:hypothetical protein